MGKTAKKYMVSHILDKKIQKTKEGEQTFYKVAWVGYPLAQSTWQPSSNLKGRLIRKEIEAFEARFKDRIPNKATEPKKFANKDQKIKDIEVLQIEQESQERKQIPQFEPRTRNSSKKTKGITKDTKTGASNSSEKKSGPKNRKPKTNLAPRKNGRLSKSQHNQPEENSSSFEEILEQVKDVTPKTKKMTKSSARVAVIGEAEAFKSNKKSILQSQPSDDPNSSGKLEKQADQAKIKILLKRLVNSTKQSKQNTLISTIEQEKANKVNKKGSTSVQPHASGESAVIKQQSFVVDSKPQGEDFHPIMTEENEKQLLQSYETSKRTREKDPARDGLGQCESADSSKFEIKGMINCKGEYYYLVEQSAKSQLLSRADVLRSNWYELVCFYERRINIQPAEVNFMEI